MIMNLGLGLVNSEWFVKGAARFVEGATFFLALKALATFSNFFCFCLRLQNQIRSTHFPMLYYFAISDSSACKGILLLWNFSSKCKSISDSIFLFTASARFLPCFGGYQ